MCSNKSVVAENTQRPMKTAFFHGMGWLVRYGTYGMVVYHQHLHAYILLIIGQQRFK